MAISKDFYKKQFPDRFWARYKLNEEQLLAIAGTRDLMVVVDDFRRLNESLKDGITNEMCWNVPGNKISFNLRQQNWNWSFLPFLIWTLVLQIFFAGIFFFKDALLDIFLIRIHSFQSQLKYLIYAIAVLNKIFISHDFSQLKLVNFRTSENRTSEH